MVQAMSGLLAGGPLTSASAWRRFGRRGLTARAHLLMAIAAALVILLASVSVAHAQATTPTVSTIAITSNPGTDNTYALGDTITVSLTFSEAVTVTGSPQIKLDIGGRERTVDYSGAGDNGVSVVENSLALNGGAIQSSDDSTAATLAHTASTFASHKVDTALKLISNLEQADGTPLRISATEAVRIDLKMWASQAIYTLDEIVLDVKTPSDTLNVTVLMVNGHRVFSDEYTEFTFTGSVSAAGRQSFKIQGQGGRVDLGRFDYVPTYVVTSLVPDVNRHFIVIKGSGTGFVELGTTASAAEDAGGAFRWNIGDRVSYSTDGGRTYQEQESAHLPRFGVVGHTKETLRINSSVVSSRPYGGSAYAAGETVEVEIRLNGPVRILDDRLVVPLWLGDGVESRRDARLVSKYVTYLNTGSYVGRAASGFEFRRSVLQFAYVVQPGDVDTDGVLIGGNPLGASTANKIEYALDPRVPMDLSFPEFQGEADQTVDGSATSTCEDIHCAYVVPGPAGSLSPGWSGYEVSVHLPQGPARLSGRVFSYDAEEYVINTVANYSDHSVSNYSSANLSMRIHGQLPQPALDHLGWKIGDVLLAFRDGHPNVARPNTLPGEDITGHDISPEHRFGWNEPGFAWNVGETVLIKIVETPVTASFNQASYAADEGGDIDVTVTLDRDFLEKTVTLPLAATNNGVTTEADYTGVPEELVFAPGETQQTFTVTLTDDEIDDDDEGLTLSFGTVPDAIKEGGDHEMATITIRDDDDPPVEISFEQDSYTVAEGDAQTVRVTLDADPEREVTILTAAKRKPSWTSGSDLGQWASPPR